MGKKLFTRHSFSIALTDAGMLLRDRAEDLVMMSDKIEKEFMSLDDVTGGELYFGLAESWLIRHLARALKALKAVCPGLQYHISELRLEGSFRLAYNASLFVREGLGYQLSFEHLVNTAPGSGLTFRPLVPRLESKLYLIWNKYQSLTPIAERFVDQTIKSTTV